jgi:hypothetical protein
MDSEIGTVTGVRTGRSGVPFPTGASILSQTYRPVLGPTRRPEYRGSPPEIKRPGRKVDHSPPSSTEGKNGWSYTSTSTEYIQGAGSECFYQI